MKLSDVIKESPTLKLGELARQKEREGYEIISLALGEPDFKTPSYVIDETIKALNEGYTHYSNPQGILELREKIAKNYNDQYYSDFNANEVIIFPGAKSAIFHTLAAIIEPEDEVIIISPYYVSYPPMIKLAEYHSKIVDIPLNSDFTLPIDKIKKAINSKTRCLILNYPNNPTGTILDDKVIDEVYKIIKDNPYLYLISDEIYDKLVFGDQKFISFAKFIDIKDQVIIINGFSKSYAMTGFRLGYAMSNVNLIKRMNLINQNINTNTNTFIQKGAESIFIHDNVHIKEYNDILRDRIDFLHKEINKLPYLSGIKPKGGFYYFVDISKTKMTSTDFSKYLIDKLGIVVTPGISFGEHWDNYIRMSLSVDKEKMEIAIEKLKKLEF